MGPGHVSRAVCGHVQDVRWRLTLDLSGMGIEASDTGRLECSCRECTCLYLHARIKVRSATAAAAPRQASPVLWMSVHVCAVWWFMLRAGGSTTGTGAATTRHPCSVAGCGQCCKDHLQRSWVDHPGEGWCALLSNCCQSCSAGCMLGLVTAG